MNKCFKDKTEAATSFSLQHSIDKRLPLNRWLIRPACFLIGTLIGVEMAHAQVNVTQFHNHLSRDGVYIDPGFTPSNAANLTRDLNFDGAVSGQVYAQPLYIENGPQGRAVIIAVTQSNNVYALDAVTGLVDWETNVVAPASASALPCGNVSPYFGIFGTPVVDLPSRSLFFNAETVDSVSGIVEHQVYSLNVDTGALNPGWPVNVNSNAVYQSNYFNSYAQGERGALTVVSGSVYIPYGGLWGDCSTYHGWVVGIPLNAPNTVMAWCTTADKGGAWACGGIASDGTDPFVATGNTSEASTWGGGEAIVHLTPELALTTNATTNYWVPTNWSTLDDHDTDIGGTGPLLVTAPGATPSNLVVALGKDGNMYVLNRTNLGGIHKPLAQLNVAGGAIIQAAATYTTTNGTYVVFENGNELNTYRIGPSNPPTITKAWIESENGAGSPFVTTTDGTNNFIVWGVGCEGDQKLHAFDGDSGTNIFTGGTASDTMANTHHMSTAIVARGRIYVGTDNQIYAFNVGPPPTVPSIASTNVVVLTNGNFQFSFTNMPGALFNAFATADLNQPVTNWTWLGQVTEVAPGQYQFTDTSGTTNAELFYTVTSP
jgi:hypothetical protein